jgi:hypothetical protein
VRVADLEGARRDYETALPIYLQIADRLGEANTRQGLGSLALALQDPQAAFEHYRAALEIHVQIENRLGMGGDFGYLARAAAAAGSFAQAALLAEQGRAILEEIHDRWGQALALRDQAGYFWQLEAQMTALACWQQAGELFRAMGAPQAERIEGLFAQFAAQMEAEAYAQLRAELAANADAIRRAGVQALQQAQEGAGGTGQPGA